MGRRRVIVGALFALAGACQGFASSEDAVMSIKTYVNDVNTVDNAVKAYPDKLEKAIAVTIPYSVGIAVPKNKAKFREAVMAALTEIYKSGDQLALLKKWDLDPENLKEPGLLTVD